MGVGCSKRAQGSRLHPRRAPCYICPFRTTTRSVAVREPIAMADSEQTLVTYLDLACASQQRRRLSETDKLTVLAAVAATRLGWPEVAEACRDQVLAHNPRHLVRRWPSIEAALATERFA